MPSTILRGWHMVAAFVSAAVLSGCGQEPPPIDVRAIGLVQAEIKRQVGMYMLAAQDPPVLVTIDNEQTDIRFKKGLFWCGTGNVDFDIVEVKAELTTALDTSAGFSATLTAPIPIAPSGTFSFSRATHNTQTLDYNLWPFEMTLQGADFLATRPPTQDDIKGAPIAAVLLNLRQAQITGATRTNYLTGDPRWPQPCFTNYDPGKPGGDPGHKFTIGLTVTTSVSGSVSVGVSALKVGASGGQTTATGHSLTVTFVQRGLAELQNAKDRVDAACKYPNALSPKCKDATEAYNQLRTTGQTGEQIYTTGANRGPIGVEKKESPGASRGPIGTQRKKDVTE
jgi:hypothetical protein